jgi:hypothetical protein
VRWRALALENKAAHGLKKFYILLRPALADDDGHHASSIDIAAQRAK